MIKGKHPGLKNLVNITSPCFRKQWLHASAPFYWNSHLNNETLEDPKLKKMLSNASSKEYETILKEKDKFLSEAIPHAGVLYENMVFHGKEDSLLTTRIKKHFGLEEIEYAVWDEDIHNMDFVKELISSKKNIVITSFQLEFKSIWGDIYSGEADFVIIVDGKFYLGEVKTYSNDKFSSSKKFDDSVKQLCWYAKAFYQHNINVDLSSLFVICHGESQLNQMIVLDGNKIFESISNSEDRYSLEVQSRGWLKNMEWKDIDSYPSSDCLSCAFYAACNEEKDLTAFMPPSLSYKGKKVLSSKTDKSYLPTGEILYIGVSILPGTSDRVLGFVIANSQGEILSLRINTFPERVRETREFFERFLNDFNELSFDSLVFTSQKSLNAIRLNIDRFFRNRNAEKDGNTIAEYFSKLGFLGDNLISSTVFFLDKIPQTHFYLPNVGYKNITNISKFLSQDSLDKISYMDLFVEDLALDSYGFDKEENDMLSLMMGAKEKNKLTDKDRMQMMKDAKLRKNDKIDLSNGIKNDQHSKIEVHLRDIISNSIRALSEFKRTICRTPADLESLKEQEDKFLESDFPINIHSLQGSSYAFLRRENFENFILLEIAKNDRTFTQNISNINLYETNNQGKIDGRVKIRKGDELSNLETNSKVKIQSVHFKDGQIVTEPPLEGGAVYVDKSYVRSPSNISLNSQFISQGNKGLKEITLKDVDNFRLEFEGSRTKNESDLNLDALVSHFSVGKNIIVKSPPGAGKSYAINTLAASCFMQKRKSLIVTQTRNQASAIASDLEKEFNIKADVFIGGSGEKEDSLVTITTSAKLAYSQDVFQDGEPYAILIDEAWQMKSLYWFIICGIDNWSNFVMVGDPGQIAPVNTFDLRIWSGVKYPPYVAAPEFLTNSSKDDYIKTNEFMVNSFPATRRFGIETVKVIQEFYDFTFGSLHSPTAIQLHGNKIPEVCKIISDDTNFHKISYDIINSLLEEGYTENEIGFVCSRSEDVSFYQSVLADFPDVLIETPERWQGLERNIILAVDPMLNPSLFSANANRMCVMASRHKNLFILLTSKNAIEMSYSYTPSVMESKNDLISSDFYNNLVEVNNKLEVKS